MKDSDCQKDCPYYNSENGNLALTDKDRREFCQAESIGLCARNFVRQALGPKHVPDDLHPSQIGKAFVLILQGEIDEQPWND